MALSRNKPRAYSNLSRGNDLALIATTTVFEGAAIGVQASTGLARPLVAGDVFAGFATATCSSVADVAGAAATRVRLHVDGEVQLAVSGVAAAHVGASVFATDDDTFALSGTSLVGEVLRVPSTGLAVVAFAGGRNRLSSVQVAANQALVSDAGILPGQRRASDGAMLWDFSTLTGYSVNNSGSMALVDSPVISARLGKTTAKSIQFTIPAGTNSELSFPAIAAAQIPNQSLSLVVEMISGDTGAQAITNLFVGTDGTYANSVLRSDQLNQYGMTVQAPIQGAALQQWAPTGTPNWNGWTRAKLRITAGTAQVVVIVHAVMAAQSCPPTICLIHDDGDATAFTELRPRLDRYGFKAGFAIINDLVGVSGTYMSWAQIDQLYRDGHDLIPHGQFNLNTYASAALAQADIEKNANALLSRGYTRGSGIYVYPNGNNEYSTADRNSIRDYLKAKGYKAAFKASGTGFHPSGKGAGAMDLPRYALNATLNTTTFFNTLDSAMESGRAMCGMIHVVLPSGATGSDMTRADLDTVLAGLATRQAAGSLRVVSPSEQVNLMGLQAWV